MYGRLLFFDNDLHSTLKPNTISAPSKFLPYYASSIQIHEIRASWLQQKNGRWSRLFSKNSKKTIYKGKWQYQRYSLCDQNWYLLSFSKVGCLNSYNVEAFVGLDSETTISRVITPLKCMSSFWDLKHFVCSNMRRYNFFWTRCSQFKSLHIAGFLYFFRIGEPEAETAAQSVLDHEVAQERIYVRAENSLSSLSPIK